MDLSVAWGLWKQKTWGILFFFLVALSQLVAYIGFKKYFGPQYSLITFHLITLALYGIFYKKNESGIYSKNSWR
jgi:hypothetical protein